MNSASSWSETPMDNSESKNHDTDSISSRYKKDLDMIKEQMFDQNLNEEVDIAKLKKEFLNTNHD